MPTVSWATGSYTMSLVGSAAPGVNSSVNIQRKHLLLTPSCVFQFLLLPSNMSRNHMALFVFSIAQEHSNAYSYPNTHTHTRTPSQKPSLHPVMQQELGSSILWPQQSKLNELFLAWDPPQYNINRCYNKGNVNSHRCSCVQLTLILIGGPPITWPHNLELF